MSRRRSAFMPFLVLGGAVLLGGWFLQEGVDRQENVYVQVRVFQEVVEHVSDQFVDPVEKGQLYQAAIDGVLDDLGDPHTSFIPASEYENFQIQATSGEYGGVGLEVVDQDHWVTVVAPIPGTSGARAGIRPGDWFVRIEGEDARDIGVDKAVEILRGEPGTTVDVEMGRAGVDQPIPFTLTRSVVHIKSVPFAVRLDGDVGYVPLQVFRNTSSDEVKAAVDSLRGEGIRSLVLDLRGNPGGLLDEGIGVAELFVGEGERVVETRGRAAGQSQTFAASRPAVYADLPTAVLIDGTSASASEIVAGALQDHDRALLVGMPSYGKGSVQTLFRLSGGNVLRLTTARWYTPVGRSIDRHPQEQAPAAAHGSLTLSGMLLPAPSDQDRPTFQSDGGRTLYGGGGIVPDVRVVPDTLASDEARAVRALYQHAGAVNSGLFAYAVQYNQNHPDLRPGFRLTDGDLARFRASLAADSVEISDDVFRGATRYLRYQLEREVALQALGDQGEFEQTRSDDTQLNRAVTLLREATSTADLLKVAGAGIPNDAAVAASGGTDESSGS